MPVLEAAFGRETFLSAVPGAQPYPVLLNPGSPSLLHPGAGMERDLERGDKAAAAMSLLGLRMLLAAPGATPCQRCVRGLSDPGLVPGSDCKRERKLGQDDAALLSALQPLAHLVLGDFCVFGDPGGVS